jgi:hypothetical protein
MASLEAIGGYAGQMTSENVNLSAKATRAIPLNMGIPTISCLQKVKHRTRARTPSMAMRIESKEDEKTILPARFLHQLPRHLKRLLQTKKCVFNSPVSKPKQ